MVLILTKIAVSVKGTGSSPHPKPAPSKNIFHIECFIILLSADIDVNIDPSPNPLHNKRVKLPSENMINIKLHHDPDNASSYMYKFKMILYILFNGPNDLLQNLTNSKNFIMVSSTIGDQDNTCFLFNSFQR